jgi:hypothetical protein
MRTLILASLGVFLVGSAAYADDPPGLTNCNWGKLTKDAIQTGFDEGQHASDPSGDGRGPVDPPSDGPGPYGSDQPRTGLPNLIEMGSLQATCEFVSDAVNLNEPD